MDQLSRFRDAQDDEDGGFEAAMAELAQGRKRTHWIWYVFPQIQGLGSSGMSRHFGVRGLEEAQAYLRDDVLRNRLARATDVVADQLQRPQPPRLDELMGSHVDALKLVSSLTLFEVAAADLHAREPHAEVAHIATRAAEVLAAAEAQGYGRCHFTVRHLASA